MWFSPEMLGECLGEKIFYTVKFYGMGSIYAKGSFLIF